MARSLNRVQLIGNLTRDPELRYTPNGNAVCSFGLATNRSWKTDTGEKHEESEFHNIVSWNKLAELCSQFLVKGRKVYVEGRLSTRSWQGQDGAQKQRTEVVIDDMILLDSAGGARRSEEPSARPSTSSKSEEPSEPEEARSVNSEQAHLESSEQAAPKRSKKAEEVVKKEAEEPSEDVTPDDIPF